jgi:hypothetical protein
MIKPFQGVTLRWTRAKDAPKADLQRCEEMIRMAREGNWEGARKAQTLLKLMITIVKNDEKQG